MEQIEWINARQRFHTPPPKEIKPKVDTIISQIVGKTVYVRDPRLMQLIVKWKQESNKPENSTEPDNFLKDPKKIAELKKTFENG